MTATSSRLKERANPPPASAQAKRSEVAGPGPGELALHAIGQAATAHSSFASLASVVARASREAFDAVRADLLVWHPDTREFVAEAVDPPLAAAVVEPRAPAAIVPLLRGVLDSATSSEIVWSRRAFANAPELAGDWQDEQRSLLTPILAGAEVIGLLHVVLAGMPNDPATMLALADRLASQCGLAFHHLRQFEQIERDATEQAETSKVIDALVNGAPVRDVLRDIAQMARDTGGVDGCRIALWQPSADELEIVAEERNPPDSSLWQPGDRQSLADWPSFRQTLATGEPRDLLVSDPGMHARERANHLADETKAAYLIPLRAGDVTLGAMLLASREARPLSGAAKRSGRVLARRATLALRVANPEADVQRRAGEDSLTGLLNHRAGLEAVDVALTAARRTGSPVSLVVVDLDDFGYFNDTHGHLAGDAVLAHLGRAIGQVTAERGSASRRGGDEFLIVLPGATLTEGERFARRLMEMIEDTGFEVSDIRVPIRLSAGVATFPRHAQSRQELLAFAETALYAAKELGGGQIGRLEQGTHSLEQNPFGALSGLVRSVDRKDRYTRDHSELVARLATALGTQIGLDAADLEALQIAGHLHDVGKIAVPDSILRKPGRLLPDEEAMMRQHVTFGELMIQGVPHGERVRDAVANHHERWDGRGYPRQRAGEAIPRLGRVMAVADAFAAMVHDRPYRKGRSVDDALAEIIRGGGAQFDPGLVEPFVAAIRAHPHLVWRPNGRRAATVQLNGPAIEVGRFS